MVNVYEEDLVMRQVAQGLRKLMRLREEHIRLTPRDNAREACSASELFNI